MLVRKPLSRWHFSIYADGGEKIGDSDGIGNLPESLIWSGQKNIGDGIYQVEVEVWDQAGNSAKDSKRVEMNTSSPQVELALDRRDEEAVVDLAYDGKVPLKYWRLEMWTKEGRIVSQAEGRELPARVGIELPEADLGQEIDGVLFYQNELGKKVRQKIDNLLAPSGDQPDAKTKKEPEGISEKWVDEF